MCGNGRSSKGILVYIYSIYLAIPLMPKSSLAGKHFLLNKQSVHNMLHTQMHREDQITELKYLPPT